MLKMNHTSFYALNVTNYHYKCFLKTSLFEIEVQTDGKNALFFVSLKIIDYQNLTCLAPKYVVKYHKNIV